MLEEHGLVDAEDIFSVSYAHPRYCSQILLDPVFKGLGLAELMASIKHDSKIKYDLAGYLKLLVYGRILDPDGEDENGETIETGSRKKGVSKEHRNQPIVQMAMFLDNSGIPVAINMFPGNTLDHQTAVPTCGETISKMGFDSKFIFIADKGICTGPIMCSLKPGRFIIPESFWE